LELSFEKSQLVDANKAFEKRDQSNKERSALSEHSSSILPTFFPIPLSAGSAFQENAVNKRPSKQIHHELQKNSETIQQLESRSKVAGKRYQLAEDRIVDLNYALALSIAGIEIDCKAFRLRSDDEATIRLVLRPGSSWNFNLSNIRYHFM